MNLKKNQTNYLHIFISMYWQICYTEANNESFVVITRISIDISVYQTDLVIEASSNYNDESKDWTSKGAEDITQLLREII